MAGTTTRSRPRRCSRTCPASRWSCPAARARPRACCWPPSATPTPSSSSRPRCSALLVGALETGQTGESLLGYNTWSSIIWKDCSKRPVSLLAVASQMTLSDYANSMYASGLNTATLDRITIDGADLA